jgi:hypothetical protein
MFERPWVLLTHRVGLHNRLMWWSCCTCIVFRRWLVEGNGCESGLRTTVVVVESQGGDPSLQQYSDICASDERWSQRSE